MVRVSFEQKASIAFVWTWGGRPSPAKHRFAGRCPTPGRTEGKIMRRKDTTFSIRISTEDLEIIKQKAEQAHLSQSDYVTRCCLGRQVVVIDGLKDVLKQLRAIGNNLNQLAVLANMGRLKLVGLEKTARELAGIGAELRELQERGRWPEYQSSIS